MKHEGLIYTTVNCLLPGDRFRFVSDNNGKPITRMRGQYTIDTIAVIQNMNSNLDMYKIQYVDTKRVVRTIYILGDEPVVKFVNDSRNLFDDM